jgi:hypothetical protein
MSVAQIVESNPWQMAVRLEEANPLLPDAVRTQGRAIQLSDHEVIVIEPAPDQQQLLSLSYAMGAELSDKRRRQSDRATAAALGFLVPDAGFCLLGGLGNRKLRRREVNISPT